ncbi:MAG: hypothetical protein JWN14_2865 [Chthonomonadales bacterium]|nr:hypothetical protein [Chthonomonadales bacterium]
MVGVSYAQAQSRTIMRLTGSIDHRLAIEMTLEREGSQLEGFYFYDRIGRAVIVSGSLSKTGRVRLEEGDASFTGTLVEGKRLTGNWRKRKGGHELPFTLDVEANPPTKQDIPGSALLEEKRLRIQRSQKRNSHDSQIRIHYPIVHGSRDAATLRKLNHALSPDVTYELGPGEKLSEDGWLDEIDYVLNYNKHSILDITFSVSGMGAYPDILSEHVLLNLKTGDPIRAADVFVPSALQSLADLIDKNFQEELRDARRSDANEGGVADRLEGLHFEVEDLDHFSVGEKGLTFRAEYGFPHAIKAAEPPGLFFYPYTTLRPYVRQDGLLAPFYPTLHRAK